MLICKYFMSIQIICMKVGFSVFGFALDCTKIKSWNGQDRNCQNLEKKKEKEKSNKAVKKKVSFKDHFKTKIFSLADFFCTRDCLYTTCCPARTWFAFSTVAAAVVVFFPPKFRRVNALYFVSVFQSPVQLIAATNINLLSDSQFLL